MPKKGSKGANLSKKDILKLEENSSNKFAACVMDLNMCLSDIDLQGVFSENFLKKVNNYNYYLYIF